MWGLWVYTNARLLDECRSLPMYHRTMEIEAIAVENDMHILRRNNYSAIDYWFQL